MFKPFIYSNKFIIKLIFAIAVFLSTITVAAQEKKVDHWKLSSVISYDHQNPEIVPTANITFNPKSPCVFFIAYNLSFTLSFVFKAGFT